MQSSARENYLVNEVTTAAPQKLHLLAIEAAIRSAQHARAQWQSGDDGPAYESLNRAEEIVGELLGGLRREAAPELVKRVASVYLFVFRCLLDASHRRDEKKLDDAIRVLEIERETWRQVCRQLGSDGPADAVADSAVYDVADDVDASFPPPPHTAGRPALVDVSADWNATDASGPLGLSLEA